MAAFLLIGAVSAQTERCAKESMQQQTVTQHEFSAVDLTSFRGPTSEVILTPSSGIHKGTVANPFGSQIGSTSNIQCLEYINGEYYGVRWSGGNHFGKVNPTTGAWTVIKSAFHTQGSDGASICHNPVDGKTYVFPWTGSDSEAPRFGYVDLATGNFTTIATWGYDGAKTYYAAIDQDGTCYAVRNISNEFGTIDLATGNFTVKATLAGITTVNFIQDLSFDRETGDLLWIAQTAEGNFYYKINKATAALTNLGTHTLNPQGFTTATVWGTPPDPCPAVTGVTATIVETNKVKVSWTAPSVTTDLTGYKVYQGGVEKATVPAGTTTWTSEALANGTYKFEVAATYSGECTPVKVAATDVVINTCDKKVSNLEVAYATDCSKATITWDAPAKGRGEVIIDQTNITHTPTGGGLIATRWDLSDADIVLADDFTITENWTVEKVTFSGFSNAPAVLPTTCAVIFYNNNAGVPGTEIVAFKNISMTATEEPTVTLPAPVALTAGTYWVGIMGVYNVTRPTSTSDPQLTNYRYNIYYGTNQGLGANMKLLDATNLFGMGTNWLNGPDITTNQGYCMHFKLEGTKGGTTPDTKYNVYRGEEKIAGPIEELTFEDKTFDKTKAYKWSVAVICPSGTDGEWVGKEMDACEDNPLPPCKPVTGVKGTFDAEKKEVLVEWTAPAGDVAPTKYEIYIGTDKFESTTLTYIHDVSALEPGDYEYEYCVLPIYATGACEGTVEKACKKESFTIIGIKGYTTSFSIVPNPATNNVTITAKENFNNIEVLSFLGQVVLTQTNVGNSTTLDISNLTNGVYFVRITSENGTSVKKFVKQ